MTYNRKWLGVLVVILTMVSCEQGDEMYQYQEVGSWSKEESIDFEFDVVADSDIQPVLTIEHSRDFRFENIYLLISYTINNVDAFSDTMSLQLADDSGYWIGDCQAEYCSVTSKTPSTIRNSGGRPVDINVNQFSRLDTVHGIHGLGVKLVQINQ